MGIKDLEDAKKLTILKSQIDSVSIEDIMADDFPTLDTEDTLSDSLALMRKTGYMEIPVVDGGTYVGMMRYGTVLRKKNTAPETKIKNMVSSLPTLTTETEITKLAENMVTNNCRQLAVLNGKKIIGIVSRSALIGIAAELKSFKDIKVWEIMTTPVESVSGNDMLNVAIDKMNNLDIRTLPVLDSSKRLFGVIGMKEVIDNGWKQGVRSFSALSKSPSTQIPVESIAVTAVLTADWEDSLEAAVEIMAERGISTLPVMEADDLVGIITEFDIIGLISACREREQLYVQISGLDEEDKIYADSMYSDIATEIGKVSKIYKPESLNIHVTRYNENGDRKKYSLIGKLFVNGRVINAKVIGWDLIQTNNDLVKKLGNEIKDIKDTRVSFRKHKK